MKLNQVKKKEKQESPAKAAKKIAIKSIQLRLIKTLKTISSELGQEAIDIEKEAKKLAKKITKNLKPGKEADKNDKPAIEAKKPAKESVVSNAKPASAPAKKSAVKATPAKATATKKEPAKTPVAKKTEK
ncbi:MAG TPA: hypothetical protein VK671_05705 [Mucilaginibacter sp.]|nr:hypothetical protein [Mucilaginibacter sp.]